MKKQKQANVIIYTIVLVNLILIMAIVVLNNTVVLELNYKYHQLNKVLSDSIESKAKLSFKYSSYLNSNGSGFVDDLSCPDSVTMSGVTLRNTGIVTSLTYTGGSIYCQGVYNSNPLFIYFNTDFTDFIVGEYSGFPVNLTGGANKVGVTAFSDGDVTQIDFLGTSYLKSDNIDDNFDSDNYQYYSTGSTKYPDNYHDDDDDARSLVYGYLTQAGDYKNVFWNNTKMENYIDININNSGSDKLSMKGETAHMYYDIDNSFGIKVSRFDKTQFNDFGELLLIDESELDNQGGGLGYLQSDLTLSGAITGSEYQFDFGTYDYAISLKNTGSGVLLYKINAETISGTGLYITPLLDADNDFIKYMGGDIIKNDEGKYTSKQFEVIEKK